MSNVISRGRPISGCRVRNWQWPDNNSTGRFLNHEYQLLSPSEAQLQATLNAARDCTAQGCTAVRHQLAQPGSVPNWPAEFAADSLLINAGSYDDKLRTDQCLANVAAYPAQPGHADLMRWLAHF